MAETDDELTMKFLEGEEISNEEIHAALRKATIARRRWCRCSAARRCATRACSRCSMRWCAICPARRMFRPLWARTPIQARPEVRYADDSQPFAGLVFKIVTDPFVGRLAYVRVYSGKTGLR